jgi:hypothetical protein
LTRGWAGGAPKVFQNLKQPANLSHPFHSFTVEWVGTTNPNPPFFIRAFAEDYPPLPHTIQEKGSAMQSNSKQQKQGSIPYSLFPVPCFSS